MRKASRNSRRTRPPRSTLGWILDAAAAADFDRLFPGKHGKRHTGIVAAGQGRLDKVGQSVEASCPCCNPCKGPRRTRGAV